MYRDCTIALLTKHHKAAMIEPALAVLGVSLLTVDQFDTDTLGTFSGSVARTRNALDCARHKARLAVELSGRDIGLGSEGSFGGGPLPGILPWDQELLCWYDSKRQIEIIAQAEGPIAVSHFEFVSWQHLKEQLQSAHHEQFWRIRTAHSLSDALSTYQQIENALLEIAAEENIPTSDIIIEADFRAMHCPARQVYIRKAAEQLTQRLLSLCPRCNMPDFWIRAAEPGLPCSACSFPTTQPKAQLWRCNACDYETKTKVVAETASSACCSLCNP